jgi:hypothetical protein
MHYRDIPFINSERKNELIFDKPLDILPKIDYIKTLPPEYSFCELIPDEALPFINQYYYVKFNNTDFLSNSIIFAIRYKSSIVALQTAIFTDISFNGIIYKAAHAEHTIVHPKLRHRFLLNVLLAHVCIEIFKRGAVIEFFQVKHKIDMLEYNIRQLYIYPLTKSAKVSLKCTLEYEIKILPDTLHLSTHEEIIKLNNPRYKLQALYTDERINSIIQQKRSLSDNQDHIVIFNDYYCELDNIRSRTAVILDIVYSDKFIKELISKFFTLGFDNIISYIPFDGFLKNIYEYQYMMNMFPVVKRNEVMMNIQ